MTSPSSTSSNYYQRWWRFAGMIAIAIAGLMAAGSIWGGILEDSAWHFVHLFSDDVPERDRVAPVGVCILYWSGFIIALLAALYLAFVDIRYIRLQYALEKQALFRQNLGDELLRQLREKNDKE